MLLIIFRIGVQEALNSPSHLKNVSVNQIFRRMSSYLSKSHRGVWCGLNFADYFKPKRKPSFNALCLSNNAYKPLVATNFQTLLTDSDSQKKIELILMEFELLKQSHNDLPDSLTERQMSDLLTYSSESKRMRYITRYLHKIHVSKLAKEQRKAIKEAEATVKCLQPESDSSEHLTYLMDHNCLHFSVRKTMVRNFYAHRLAQAAIFAPPLVFDCDFEEHMNRHESMNTAMLLRQAYGINSAHRTPFDLYFCNLKDRGESYGLLQNLENVLPSLNSTASMITVKAQSYLELFPDKEKLVYLSPDAYDMMDCFDPDAVYIIAALVDRAPGAALTLAKAKKEGIRCQRLPLDKYLRFRPGTGKVLPLNLVIKILLEVHSSGQWHKALSHVPSRAVLSSQEIVDREAKRVLKSTGRYRKGRPADLSELDISW